MARPGLSLTANTMSHLSSEAKHSAFKPSRHCKLVVMDSNLPSLTHLVSEQPKMPLDSDLFLISLMLYPTLVNQVYSQGAMV